MICLEAPTWWYGRNIKPYGDSLYMATGTAINSAEMVWNKCDSLYDEIFIIMMKLLNNREKYHSISGRVG